MTTYYSSRKQYKKFVQTDPTLGHSVRSTIVMGKKRECTTLPTNTITCELYKIPWMTGQ